MNSKLKQELVTSGNFTAGEGIHNYNSNTLFGMEI